jgi:hypothetical protein
MYIVPIAWIYVALMMAVAEATNTNGTLLGAIVTFLLYGVAPVALVVYLMGAPRRRKALKAREAAQAAEHAAAVAPGASGEPNTSGEPPAAPEGPAVATVREKS